MRSGRFTIIALAVYVLASTQALVAVVPPPATATCRISCTVANIVEWAQPHFPDIDLGELTTQRKQAVDEAVLVLYTNGNVTIIANNSDTAELSFGPHTLLTKYKLKYDGSGTSQTGGKPTQWRTFDKFLEKGSDVLHVLADGAVEVTLSVKASIKKNPPKSPGRYEAIQTLTVCWKS